RHLHQNPQYGDGIWSTHLQAKRLTAKEEQRDSEQRPEAKEHDIEPRQPENPAARLEFGRDLISGPHKMRLSKALPNGVRLSCGAAAEIITKKMLPQKTWR